MAAFMQPAPYLIPIPDLRLLADGALIRRLGAGTDQQALFRDAGEDGIVVSHAIDLNKCTYEAESAVMKLRAGDNIHRYSHRFADSPARARAEQVLCEWTLFKNTPALQAQMAAFTRTLYSAEQVLDMKNADALKQLFVPLQMKFRIGKFMEKTDGARAWIGIFNARLSTLGKGDHMTYIALIPQQSSHNPCIYSAGTMPHQETHKRLDAEEFRFKPTHGGHIKCVGTTGSIKTFIVDAGSNYVGRGVKTPFSCAEAVVKVLYRLDLGHTFIPVEGRGAFGTEQSY
jgi:hypothetical protein